MGLGLAAGLMAQESTLPDFSVPSGMVSRDFPLGMADLSMVEQLCEETLSPDGKYHIFQAARKIRVIDRPEQVETIRQMLPHLSQPAPNVKVEFVSRTMGQESLRGFEVTGRGRGRIGDVGVSGRVPRTPGVFRRSPGGDPGDITHPVPPSGVTIRHRGGAGSLGIGVADQNKASANLNSQFIVVRSGSEGFIEVAREVPMIDFFTRFVADGSFGAVLGVTPRVAGNPNLLVLTGGHFEVPQIRWEKEGSQLLVRPVVEGNLVHLTIMPQISAVKIVDPAVFRARGLNTFLTGREQYVTYTRLATTVTVQSGQEVTIGGFSKASPEFNRFFFGGTRSSRESHSTFTVRATIQ